MSQQTTNAKNSPRQQEFFGILQEFFERATGKSPNRFATYDSFGDEIRKNAFGIPSLAAVALGCAATKIDQRAKRNQRAKSLVGVLAAAKAARQSD